MTDISIPADVAATIAWELRARAKHHRGALDAGDLTRLADLLDPPPSLRDEVHAVIVHDFDHWTSRDTADAILAVVRRHVEGLPHPSRAADSQGLLHRDDVLRLLGKND